MVITLKTKPISTNQLYGGRRYLTKLGKDTKEAMAWEVKSQWKGRKLLTGEISVLVYFYVPNMRSDIDNFLKGFLDCMTGIVWKDDHQIVELHCFKIKDKKDARIELEVEDLTP